MQFLTAIPAYGRDYKSKKEVISDWEAGKDFQVQSFGQSGYVNINDCPKNVTLNIRYKKLTQVCVIKSV